MNHQRVRACSNHRAAQRIQRHFRILIVDTDAALYRDRNFDGLLHRRNAFSHELRLRHQARAEPAVLHAIRRTADIEIDLVVAEAFADPCALGEIARIRATELKRNGMLARIEAKQPLTVAMDDGAGRQHLGVKPSAPRQKTMEDAAMPVCPIHHRATEKYDYIPMLYP
jgi:hypothetical protein